jgi:hypothetical protein
LTGSISSSRNSNSSDVYKLIMTVIILGSAIIPINQIFSNPKINLIALPKVYASEGVDTPFNTTDYISDLFVFGSGLFAAILSALSLNAYKNIRTRRLLIVSIAFAIFSIHAIVSKLDLFAVKLESSILELVLAILTFVPLALFFLAIVRREKIKTKNTTEESLSR